MPVSHIVITNKNTRNGQGEQKDTTYKLIMRPLEDAGLSKVRRAFYRALAETGIGREAVIIATKP